MIYSDYWVDGRLFNINEGSAAAIKTSVEGTASVSSLKQRVIIHQPYF